MLALGQILPRSLLALSLALSNAGRLAQENSGVPTFGTTVVASSGLRGDIYLLPSGTITLPRFNHLKPIGSVYTTSLNIPPRAFIEGFPGITNRVEWFAIDYTGRIWIEEGGRYQFVLSSDDGSKLYFDGHLMINNDGIHPPVKCAAGVELSRGVHEMRVSYFQGPRFELSLVLAVAGPGGSLRIFDTRDFAPSGELSTAAPGVTHKPRARRVEGGRCGAF